MNIHGDVHICILVWTLQTGCWSSYHLHHRIFSVIESLQRLVVLWPIWHFRCLSTIRYSHRVYIQYYLLILCKHIVENSFCFLLKFVLICFDIHILRLCNYFLCFFFCLAKADLNWIKYKFGIRFKYCSENWAGRGKTNIFIQGDTKTVRK